MAFSILVGSFPWSPRNNTIHFGNSFHFGKSLSPFWGEVVSHNNELVLLNRVKLTAAEQLHCCSKRKGGLEPWKNVGKVNRQSPTFLNGGNQNAPRVPSKIPAPSAFSNQACNKRKKLGSPESNKRAGPGIY